MNERMKKGTPPSAGDVPWLDSWLIVGREQIADHGEDAAVFSIRGDAAMIGAFDGLGGSGARRYEKLSDHSGAFIASRAAAAAGWRWFQARCAPEANCLHDCIAESLQTCGQVDAADSASRPLMKSSMIRSFPTTVSVVVCAPAKGGVNADFYWAGDSRGYLLTPSGLRQITQDDVEETDLIASMACDGVMNNLASQSKPWQLHRKAILCRGPAIAITATDGCFGYVPTPMDFEYLLLAAMSRASSVLEWQAELDGELQTRAGDDYTLLALLFGFGAFSEMKRQFAGRLENMRRNYMKPLENASPQEREALWVEYSKKYLSDDI